MNRTPTLIARQEDTMESFQLFFSVENDAFQECEVVEIARILRKIAVDIVRDASGDKAPRMCQTIHDINGNDIGRYAVKAKQ